jgi:hypothetical protein
VDVEALVRVAKKAAGKLGAPKGSQARMNLMLRVGDALKAALPPGLEGWLEAPREGEDPQEYAERAARKANEG